MRPDDAMLISAEGLGKAYRIWKDPASRLKAPLVEALRSLIPAPLRRTAPASSPYYHDFDALRDVTFSVRRGETLGIIGRNGSGKSTLLQIICGTLQPTYGNVEVKGRVAALLELGSGFNPEFTGRENVFLNAAILGVSRDEAAAQMDSILAFADIGEFIDQPVKTYSSGMMVRLAFAVAVSVKPDLLIVDEALSVGDVFFQQKCFDRLRELQSQGVSLLFVSHDMGAVRNLCDRCVLLNKGRVVFDGPPEEAVSRYYAVAAPDGDRSPVAMHKPAQPVEIAADFESKRLALLAGNILPTARSRHGNGGLTMLGAVIRDLNHQPVSTVNMEDTVQIAVLVKAERRVETPSVGIHLYDRMNNLVFAAGTRNLGLPLAPMSPGEERIVEFELGLAIQPGEYTYSLGCSEAIPGMPNIGNVLDRVEGLGPIAVVFPSDTVLPFHGAAKLPLRAKALQGPHA